MSPETKETALAKLDTMRVKVGYPDKWRTYEGVTIEESLAQTLLSANLAETKRQLARIGEPVDREEWDMLPQEVNAYYNPTNNEIVFPAAILQSPFFDYQADPAFNYGGIGATIGHEITHGFDQSGSQFDAEGNLVNWWTDGRSGRVRGADGGGRRAVRRGRGAAGAVRRWRPDDRREHRRHGRSADRLRRAAGRAGRRGRPRPDRGAHPGAALLHRLRLSAGPRRRESKRSATQVLTDEHAPAAVRAVQPARNMDSFFETFGIEPGDPMYLPPEERIVIW